MSVPSRLALPALLCLAATAAAQQAPASAPTPYQRAVAAGYKAAMLCSGVFDAGRSEQQVAADELRGIYADYDAIVPTLRAAVDRRTATVTVPFAADLPARRAAWNAATGCTLYPIGSAPPPVVASYARPPAPAPADPRPWPLGDAGIAPRPSPALAAAVGRAFDRATYGAQSETVGVVVLRDGRVVAERYRDGWGPFAANRTWSVAKSITGTLVGLAAAQGLAEVDAPARIPEWNTGDDPRRRIRLDQLLRMGSGLHSGAAGNRTDAIYFAGTAVTEQATGWPLEAKPGGRFRYANDDILLAARSLRQSLGEARYRDWPAAQLFRPLGLAHTRAGVDWRGNYILSSQVWSTARDLARLGQFWLQDGVWQGRRMLPDGWMRYMTAPTGPQPADGPGYGATMWLFGPKQGLPAGSYAAQGNRGQYVMVIPSQRLVVVRRGEDPGAARFDIARFAADVAVAR